MRGWQGYPSEKSWFSIHFPWVNHTLYYPGAPECPAVVGHSLHFATPDLSKRKKQLAGTLGMVESVIHCWVGMPAVSRTGVCNSNQNILALWFLPHWDTELCVPYRLGDLCLVVSGGRDWNGAGLKCPNGANIGLECSAMLLDCFALVLLPPLS